jgi:hypothetical protein
MAQPRSTTPGSVMPRYPHLLTGPYDTSLIGSKMRALRAVGVPYTDGEIGTAVAAMQAQAKVISAEVEAQQGPTGLADKEIVALTAFLQRLGTDIKWKRPQAQLPLTTTTAVAQPAAPPAAPVAPPAASAQPPAGVPAPAVAPAAASAPPAPMVAPAKAEATR